MLQQLKKLKYIFPFISKQSLENVEFDQEYWDSLYGSGRWDFLHTMSELAHYSVLVGYCQYFSPEGDYLEVGCGEGILQQRLHVLPYSSYIGIDISQTAIDTAKQYIDKQTVFKACDALSFKPDKLYDVIIFNESLYCFNDCLSVLEHFADMLKEKGVFIISMHTQQVSKSHWEKIDKRFEIIDSVSIKNNQNVQWCCKAIKPEQ